MFIPQFSKCLVHFLYLFLFPISSVNILNDCFTLPSHWFANMITGLEEAMEFLQQSFPDVQIAIAHGKVIFSRLIL